MTVFRNSRYIRVKKYQIEDADGNINLIYEPRDFPDNIVAGSTTHLVKSGETFLTLAYNYLIQQGVPWNRIVLYGESLGTGVAVQTAATHRVGAVVLDSPYTSLVDVAKATYRILPVETFMVDRFESKTFIGRVHAPLLIIHGEQDVVVSPKLSEELFELANEPKERVTISRAGHSDIYYFGAFATLQRFLNDNLK